MSDFWTAVFPAVSGHAAAMDWLTSAVLAAIILSGGIGRTRQRSVWIRRTLGGAWHMVEHPWTWQDWGIVSCWPPAIQTLLLDQGDAPEYAVPPGTMARTLQARWQRVGWRLPALSLGGLVALVAFVLGLPAAVASSGSVRVFMVCMILLVGWAAMLALLAASALVRLAVPRRRALGMVTRLLSPFEAPRAVECVLVESVRDLDPLVVAYALLPRHEFLSWLRPRYWDHCQGDQAVLPDFRALEDAVGKARLRRLLAERPADVEEAEAWCPRCGLAYRADQSLCADCTGVALWGGQSR